MGYLVNFAKINQASSRFVVSAMIVFNLFELTFSLQFALEGIEENDQRLYLSRDWKCRELQWGRKSRYTFLKYGLLLTNN